MLERARSQQDKYGRMIIKQELIPEAKEMAPQIKVLKYQLEANEDKVYVDLLENN